jgi:hypothetical protein
VRAPQGINEVQRAANYVGANSIGLQRLVNSRSLSAVAAYVRAYTAWVARRAGSRGTAAASTPASDGGGVRRGSGDVSTLHTVAIDWMGGAEKEQSFATRAESPTDAHAGAATETLPVIRDRGGSRGGDARHTGDGDTDDEDESPTHVKPSRAPVASGHASDSSSNSDGACTRAHACVRVCDFVSLCVSSNIMRVSLCAHVCRCFCVCVSLRACLFGFLWMFVCLCSSVQCLLFLCSGLLKRVVGQMTSVRAAAATSLVAAVVVVEVPVPAARAIGVFSAPANCAPAD